MKSLMKMTWMETKLFLREPVGSLFHTDLPLDAAALNSVLSTARQMHLHPVGRRKLE